MAVIALLAFAGRPSFAGEKQATTDPRRSQFAVAKGTKLELVVRKDGYVPWVTHSVANDGKFTMNANLTREVFR